jgi:hypothetical protein
MVSSSKGRRGAPRTSGVQARALGMAIHKQRMATGRTLVSVAKQAGISKSTLGRLENGLLPQQLDITRILVAIGLQDPEFQELKELAEAARSPNWLAARGGADLPWQLQMLIDYEQIATHITQVSLGLIPGLLQTEDYAREVLALGGVAQEDLNCRLSARMKRQAVLDRSTLTFEAIVDELALGRPFGSRGVVIRQLQHLVGLAARPNLSVRVMPRDLPLLAARNTSYIVMAFDGLPEVVHMEYPAGGMFLDSPQAVDSMRHETDRLRASSLSPAQSVELIRDTMSALESHD